MYIRELYAVLCNHLEAKVTMLRARLVPKRESESLALGGIWELQEWEGKRRLEHRVVSILVVDGKISRQPWGPLLIVRCVLRYFEQRWILF